MTRLYPGWVKRGQQDGAGLGKYAGSQAHRRRPLTTRANVSAVCRQARLSRRRLGSVSLTNRSDRAYPCRRGGSSACAPPQRPMSSVPPLRAAERSGRPPGSGLAAEGMTSASGSAGMSTRESGHRPPRRRGSNRVWGARTGAPRPHGRVPGPRAEPRDLPPHVSSTRRTTGLNGRTRHTAAQGLVNLGRSASSGTRRRRAARGVAGPAAACCALTLAETATSMSAV
jgi:hypothetical protein